MSENQSAEERQKYLQETHRSALYLWVGLVLAMTLFYVQSQLVFIKSKPIATSAVEWPLIILGALTFLFGYYFFNNYMSIRKKAVLKAKYRDRKQTLLIAYVYQFILFETLGLYGVVISVFTQNAIKALPFMAAAYIGFALRFPKKAQVEPFFGSA